MIDKFYIYYKILKNFTNILYNLNFILFLSQNYLNIKYYLS